MGTNLVNAKTRNCRTKLQNKFEECESISEDHDRSTQSRLTLSLNDTRRILRTGAEKICKSFNELRTSIGTFAQKFRLSTKRRQILDEGAMTPGCATPNTFSRVMLGRTPTKLYSPFRIDSPYNKHL
ncbi:hypothetical protein RN001_010360 [Aquatica leii]|uniref:Uncharacterized protein n=1 Tax=Aquatica leii TaxID=1421715 RepID=A0AAN7P6C5_9COLE|nr:hypothetical protein RN001_010360 [Aquatica leii]